MPNNVSEICLFISSTSCALRCSSDISALTLSLVNCNFINAATQSKVNSPVVNAPDEGQNHAEVLTALIEEADAEKPKTTGVVMIATGHPYYAHMAANLATAIKYQSPGLSITLFHDGKYWPHVR